jgi:hypothetical protein
VPGRRGRNDADLIREKTNSVLTLQPGIMSEASPAVKWANKYDKEAIREAYLANANAGRGLATATMQTNGHSTGNGHDRIPEVPSRSSSAMALASPAVMPTTPSVIPPSIAPEDEEGPEPPSEKAVEAPQDVHPVERPVEAGRSSPMPPTQAPASMEIARDNMISPEPGLSPESKKQAKKLHKEKEKGGGGFRKLFGRNKNRQSKLPDNAADQLKAMQQQPAAPSPQPVVPEKPKIKREETQYMTPDEEISNPAVEMPASATPPGPGPISEPIYEASEEPDDVSRVNTAEATEAAHEFSRFDQGPLLDQPAFIPDEGSDDDAVPPPIARHPSRSPVAPEAEAADGESTPKGVPSQDRWAQIRKNAADRAAQRQSEELSAGAPSKTTDGDDETSGEESEFP